MYGVQITVYVVVVGHWTVAFSDESSEEGNGKSVDKCIQVDRTKSNLTSILKPSPGICVLGVRLAAPPPRNACHCVTKPATACRPVHESLYPNINQLLKSDSCFVINCWKCTYRRGWQKSRRYLITMALYKQHINYKEQRKIKQDVFYYEQTYLQHG